MPTNPQIAKPQPQAQSPNDPESLIARLRENGVGIRPVSVSVCQAERSPDDVIMLMKQHMCDRCLCQQPQVVLSHDRIPGVPLSGPSEIMPRNALGSDLIAEFQKTASHVEQRPWAMTRAAEYLRDFCRRNQGGQQAQGSPPFFEFGEIAERPSATFVALPEGFKEFASGPPKLVRVVEKPPPRVKAKAKAKGSCAKAKAVAAKAAVAKAGPKAVAKAVPKASPTSAVAKAVPKASPKAAVAKAVPKASPKAAVAKAVPKASPSAVAAVKAAAKANPKAAAAKAAVPKAHPAAPKRRANQDPELRKCECFKEFPQSVLSCFCYKGTCHDDHAAQDGPGCSKCRWLRNGCARCR